MATTEREQPASDDNGGETDGESGPLRRCALTRERLPKERMIRFVLGPDRQLIPDLAGRLPGRGLWLSASGDVIQSGIGSDVAGHDLAQRNLGRALARAAHGPVKLPADLFTLLEAGLLRRIGELLGLTRRAGQAVAGYEKAREMLVAGRARLVVQASDGSMAERTRFLSGAKPGIDVIDPLAGETLGRVFGRDYTVHVAVAPGKLAELLTLEAGRLAGLRQRSGTIKRSDGTTGRRIAASIHEQAGANG